MAKYRLTFRLEVGTFMQKDRTSKQPRPHPVIPSWNDILSMDQWARTKLKENIQHTLLSALRACAEGSSTTTTSVRSIWSMRCATLALSLETHLQQRALKRANAKREKAKKNIPSSKSSPAPIPSSPISSTDDGLRIMSWVGSLHVVRVEAIGNRILRPATPSDIRNIRPL